MKKLILLLSVIVITVCAFFSTPARNLPESVAPAHVAESGLKDNQARTIVPDLYPSYCLAMYENFSADLFTDRTRSYRQSESFSIATYANSKFFRTKPEFYRKIQLTLF